MGYGEDIAYYRATRFDPTNPANNINLGALTGGESSRAYSINDMGHIVGSSDMPFDNPDDMYGPYATRFDPSGNGQNICLGAIGGSPDSYCASEALCINNQDQIVGWAMHVMTDWGGEHATLFDKTGGGNNLDLGTLISPFIGTDEEMNYTSKAYSINDLGNIVGISEWDQQYLPPWDWENNEEDTYWYQWEGEQHATLFDSSGNGMNLDLNLLIDTSLGWELLAAYDINNQGQIVGKGFYDGNVHAFLLNPVAPEPATLSLLVLGGLAAARKRRA